MKDLNKYVALFTYLSEEQTNICRYLCCENADKQEKLLFKKICKIFRNVYILKFIPCLVRPKIIYESVKPLFSKRIPHMGNIESHSV